MTASGRYNIAHVDLYDQLGTNLNGDNHFVHFNPAIGATYKVLEPSPSTWGILSDPTGINAPGVPPDGVTNGPGVNNRFLSPAAPIELFGGVRITF